MSDPNAFPEHSPNQGDDEEYVKRESVPDDFLDDVDPDSDEGEDNAS
jgi:hypothetical protein